MFLLGGVSKKHLPKVKISKENLKKWRKEYEERKYKEEYPIPNYPPEGSFPNAKKRRNKMLNIRIIKSLLGIFIIEK